MSTNVGSELAKARWSKPRSFDNPQTVGERVRARRLAFVVKPCPEFPQGKIGLTMAELGEQVHVPVPTLSQYERNRGKPPPDVLACIALALEVDVDELLGPPEPAPADGAEPPCKPVGTCISSCSPDAAAKVGKARGRR